MPLTKLCTTDPLIREYLLYFLLDVASKMGRRIHVPPGNFAQQHTPESWSARGRQLVE